MSWQEIYQSKLVSLKEAASLIKPNDHIFYSLAGSAPPDLINAISERLPELGYVRFHTGMSYYPHDYLNDEKYQGLYEHFTAFTFLSERYCSNKQGIHSYAMHASDMDSLIESMNIDVVLCECPPPDENGNLNFGFYGTSSNAAAIKNASRVIVQVNKNAPYVFGDQNFIHVSEVTAIVEADHGYFDVPPIPITEVESKIASYIVERIDDGSTVQFGIGGLANAICSFLDSKKDLGVHSEMFVDTMVPLIQKGIINGSRKTLHPGEVTVVFGSTTNEGMAFLDRNPAVKFYPFSYVNNPYIIAKNDNFVAVNNALMADLTGQVGSESIGFRQYSASGGQVDFVRGARMSKNGKSFISLPSCTNTKDGEISTIVLSFQPGQVITTPRTDMDMVVTEYGVAELRNKCLRDRVKAMIAIAHPKFRDELTSQAKKVGLL